MVRGAPSDALNNTKTTTDTRCLRCWAGKWKLIVGSGPAGAVPLATWLGQFTPNASTPVPVFPHMHCPWEKPCLYNMDIDKTEHHDVAAANPAVVKEMMAMFAALDSVRLMAAFLCARARPLKPIARLVRSTTRRSRTRSWTSRGTARRWSVSRASSGRGSALCR